ncbi:hypothetical protein C8R44DRAFT_777236 [Mycena epipterygia]|nr:hypothetical protein C8R44DRAFT_777236 [Mycena epipterygia]
MPAQRMKRTAGAESAPKKKDALRTKKTDILISIKRPHIDNIVARIKNHEFRKYLIPGIVQRMWFYVSSPDQTLRYIAVVSNGKTPGEIEKENGIGNADFNKGPKDAYAYEILHLYRLRVPLPIARLREDHGISPPQRYAYVPEALFEQVLLEEQELLF